VKDKKGLYYYPYPQNKRVRMYVRKADDQIWFRLWNEDDPELWDEHGWVPYDAIQQAAAMHSGKGFNPRAAYDIQVAERLLKDSK
jgi:hypothetical protein